MGLTIRGIVSDTGEFLGKVGHTGGQIVEGTGNIFEGSGEAAKAGGEVAGDIAEYFPLILVAIFLLILLKA